MILSHCYQPVSILILAIHVTWPIIERQEHVEELEEQFRHSLVLERHDLFVSTHRQLNIRK